MAGYAEAGQQQRFRGRLSDRSSSARRARAPTSAREVLRPATIEVVGLMSLGRLWLNAGLTVRSQRCFDFELAAGGNLHRLVERGLDFFSTRTRDGVQNGLDRCSVESARHRAAGSRDGRKVRIGCHDAQELVGQFWACACATDCGPLWAPGAHASLHNLSGRSAAAHANAGSSRRPPRDGRRLRR